MSLILPLSVVVGCLAWVVFRRNSGNPQNLPYPPGPPGRLIAGNAMEIPVDFQYFKFAEWARQYGDFMSLSVFGQRIVVISSQKRAEEVFEKRSGVYSSRGRFLMLRELMGLDWNMVFLPYGEEWKKQRQSFHSYFNQSEIQKFMPIQLRETHLLLRRLLDDPQRFYGHCRQLFAGTIMEVAYGIRVEGPDDPFVKNGAEVMRSLGIAGAPGRYWVDAVPILKYVPEWFPFAQFQKQASFWKGCVDKFLEEPWEKARQQLAEGSAKPSLAVKLMSELAEGTATAEQVRTAKAVANVAYAGGSDTTVAVTQTFFLAMTMHPEIVKKAQSQLDKIIGPDRLPEFKDRAQLPYIMAIVKEVLRWIPVVPFAVPHSTTEDDIYDGYFIPKDSVVVGNVWAILHDPAVYSEPEKFKPERWLTAEGQLDTSVPEPDAAFGFGRRICPGRWMGNNSLFSAFASVLYAFDISAPVDVDGNKVMPTGETTPSLITAPLPFDCVIKPRSAAAAALVRETASEE